MAEQNDTVRTLVVGALSGLLADSVTHPVCTIKARLMVQSANPNIQKYSGLFNGFTTIIQKEGLRGLYPGFSAVAVGAAPAQALYFTGYETTRKVLGSHTSANFLSGIFAQLFGSMCWVPMEVVKEKLMIQGQMQTKTAYSGSFNLVSNVIKNEGIRGLYRGFLLQQLTYGPFNGLAIMFYNEFKSLLPEGTFYNLLSSGAGYAIASVLTNPFDVVKTRRQVQMSNPDVFNYKNGVDCFQQILKNEGVKHLFDGVTARIGWLTPRCAIAMTSYEFLYKQFSQKQELQY